MLSQDKKRHWEKFLVEHYDSIVNRTTRNLDSIQCYAIVKYLWKWFNAIY
jgi:hypothetical protein